MKKLIVSLCMLALVALPVMAAVKPPPKSELTLGASFEKVKSGGSIYEASGALLTPLFGSHLLVGPQATLSNSEYARSVGVRGEFGIKTFYVGGAYDYFLSDVADRGAATAFAGFKSAGRAFLKVEADRVVQGRGKDAEDYSGFVAIGKRW